MWTLYTQACSTFTSRLKSLCMVNNIKMQKVKVYMWVNTGNLIDSVVFLASVVQTCMPKHRLWPRFAMQLIFGMCFNLFSGYFSRSEGWGIDCLWARETLTASGQAEWEFTSLFRSGQLMPEFGQDSVSLMKGFKVVHRYKQTGGGGMQDGLRFDSILCADISKPHMPFPGFKLPKIHPDRTSYKRLPNQDSRYDKTKAHSTVKEAWSYFYSNFILTLKRPN